MKKKRDLQSHLASKKMMALTFEKNAGFFKIPTRNFVTKNYRSKAPCKLYLAVIKKLCYACHCCVKTFIIQLFQIQSNMGLMESPVYF